LTVAFEIMTAPVLEVPPERGPVPIPAAADPETEPFTILIAPQVPSPPMTAEVLESPDTRSDPPRCDPIVRLDSESHLRAADHEAVAFRIAVEARRIVTELPSIASGSLALTEMLDRKRVSVDELIVIEFCVELPVTASDESRLVDGADPLHSRRIPLETTTEPAPMSQRTSMIFQDFFISFFSDDDFTSYVI
jgi:hypothetical protein